MEYQGADDHNHQRKLQSGSVLIPA